MILDCKDGKLEKGRIQNDLLKLQSGMRSHSIEDSERILRGLTGQKLQWLLWPNLQGHLLLFPQYPIGYIGQPYSVWVCMSTRAGLCNPAPRPPEAG